MLRQRLVAAALGLPMLFLLLWLNWHLRMRGSTDDLPLLLILVIIAGASGWEVGRIVHHRLPAVSPLNGVYAALILPFLVHMIRPITVEGGLAPAGSLSILIDSLGATTAVMLLFLGVWGDVEQHGRRGLLANLAVLAGGLYLGIAMSALMLLGASTVHEIGVLFVFAAVFTLDTAAYFGGRRLGGLPLAPAVSPKKTVSGAVCGLLAVCLLAVLVKLSSPLWAGSAAFVGEMGGALSWMQFAWVALVLGIVGQLGDLVESAFKRWSGVKDSGAVIPGHGGFLDRFDSLFLAAPAVYLLLRAFLQLPSTW